MNSNVVAALMTKLELLFGKTESSFLAFQIPGFPISPRDLDFRGSQSESGLTPQDALNAASDFARLVNFIPVLSSSWSSDGRTLWNEYETILTQAVVASDAHTADEIAELQKAKDFLYKKRQITDQFGTRDILDDSPELAAYRQYQQAYLTAKKEYNNLKLTAENSSNPKVLQEWQLQEPEYKAKVNSAYADWVAKGYKQEVEEAFADIDRITGGNPQVAWANWKDDFKQSVLTDLLGQNFYETHFWPANFYKAGSQIQWTKLTLDASEIEALSAKATDSTRNLATNSGSSNATQAVDLDISSLSVELARVEIMRSWLNPSVFQSSFWKWSDGREPLSDGQEPPHGSLLAYATSIVFARNLEINLKPNSEKNAQVVRNLQAGKVVLLGPLLIKPLSPAVEPKSVVRLRSASASLSLRQVSPAILKPIITPKSIGKLPSASLEPLPLKQVSPVVDSNSVSKLSSELNKLPLRQVSPVINSSRLAELILAARQSPPPGQVPDVNSEKSDGLQMIALICQRLPKSPNPNPTLKW